MRVPHRHRQREQIDVEMTPMIDVVFLLLIYFLWTASFQISVHDLTTNVMVVRGASEQQQTDPPEEPPPEQIVIKVRATGDWTINGQVHSSFASLREKIAGYASLDLAVPVFLDTEGDVPLGDVIDVYDMCRLEGLKTPHFATSDDAY
jgi:biopolymer transport protein ExbD